MTDSLEERVAALEAQNQALEAKLEAQEKRLDRIIDHVFGDRVAFIDHDGAAVVARLDGVEDEIDGTNDDTEAAGGPR